MLLCLRQPIRTVGHNCPPFFFFNLETKHAEFQFLFLESRDSSQVWPPTYTPFLPWPLIPRIGEVELCYSWKVSPTTGHFSSEPSPWWKVRSLWDSKKNFLKGQLFKQDCHFLFFFSFFFFFSCEMFPQVGILCTSRCVCLMPGRLSQQE